MIRRVTILVGLLQVALMAFSQMASAQRFATAGPYGAPAGQSPTAEMLRDVSLEQHLNDSLPLDAMLRDEAGSSVKLAEYFQDKPVVLMVVQYRCPMLCTQVLNGFLKSSQAIPAEIGRDFQVVTISFDPREGPGLAAEKKRHYSRVYRRPGAANGWHFLTGDQQSIDRITQSIGFRYRYDQKSGQFAHPSGLVVATPDGRLSRYLYGIDFVPADLRLALAESSSGRIGTTVDQILLLCFHYDPLTGRYGLAIASALRLAGIVTVAALFAFLVVMHRHECQRPRLERISLPLSAAAALRTDSTSS